MEAGQNHTELIKQWEEGQRPASQIYVELRRLKDDIDMALKSIEDNVMDELVRMNNYEDLVVYGKKIIEVQGRTTYHYKENSKWMEADQERKRIERLIKTATTDNVQIIDSETGEIIEPVTKSQGKSYLKLETHRG